MCVADSPSHLTALKYRRLHAHSRLKDKGLGANGAYKERCMHKGTSAYSLDHVFMIHVSEVNICSLS